MQSARETTLTTRSWCLTGVSQKLNAWGKGVGKRGKARRGAVGFQAAPPRLAAAARRP